MIGAIIGDIAGSRFEFIEDDGRDKNFKFWAAGCRPTDDSFMTLAVAKALFLAKGDKEKLKQNIVFCMKSVAQAHPNTGWGEMFYRWLFKETKPYNSFGNGAGMRISPVGWVAESEEEVKELSKIVTEVSHNHPEGLKGAEAVAMAVYLARTGKTKREIRERMQEYYPQAMAAFLDSESFEDAVRNAIWIGGDSDTIGAMAGSIAEAYYGVPPETEEKALSYLTDDLQGLYHAFALIRKERVERGGGE